MHMKLITLSASILLISLLACGGANQAMISQTEIDAAQQSGRLAKLYDKANGLVSESNGSAKKEAIALRSNIVHLLVAEKEAKVDELLQRYQSDSMSVDRVTVNVLKKELAPMQQWSATDYSLINTKLDLLESKITARIDSANSQAQKNTLDKVAHVQALETASILAGQDTPEQRSFIQTKNKSLSELLQQGGDALIKRQFDISLQSAQSALLLDSGNVQFESMLSQAHAGIFEAEFRRALESGKPESAYQAMTEVADKPIFSQLKKSMHKSLLLLANYFAGSAQSSYSKGDLATAYENFKKGRDIQQKISVFDQGFIQEKQFLDLLMTKTKQQDLADGNKLSLLRIISEFDKNYPGANSEFLRISDVVKNRAMTKLVVADFKEIPSEDSVVASVGRRVSSKLEKILFERLGDELLVMADTSQQLPSGYHGLMLRIDGEVLQAAIETSTNSGKRTQNVQTGIDSVETEEYKSWSKRKKGSIPKQFDETPIFENVELTIQHIRKQAIAEIAFRIVEPANSAILLTENFVREGEFVGESINEFQKGDFHQLYLRADLPSDIKIMDTLASELAEKLGDKLTQYLKSPELVFYQKSKEALSQGDNKSAIEMLANAIAIGEGKEKDVTDWTNEIKLLVLQ